MQQPRILILSSNFNSGDAITALNLFSKWDKDKLFCASLSFGNYTHHFASCYRLGKEEVRYIFPFNLLQSLPASICDYTASQVINRSTKNTFLDEAYKHVLMPVLQYTGLYGDRMRIHTSTQFVAWLDRIAPDYVYTSVGTLEMAKFVYELMIKYPKIHFIIHGYDDWMEPNYKIGFRKIFRNRSEKVFRKILSKAALLFATSNKMAEDYRDRYGIQFVTFPNPVKFSNVESHKIRHNILFIGKIGNHNLDSIVLMAEALRQFNAGQKEPLKFEIYSNVDYSLQQKIENICADIVFYDWVNHEDIPLLLAESKVLFLPISINKSTEKFTRYSMSTKMSEFLSSSRPVIYCGPKNIAMTDFLLQSNCSIVITENRIECFLQALERIVRKESSIEELQVNARKICREVFDVEVVANQLLQQVNTHYQQNCKL